MYRYVACLLNDSKNCDLENILDCSGQAYFTVVIQKYLRHAKEGNKEGKLNFFYRKVEVWHLPHFKIQLFLWCELAHLFLPSFKGVALAFMGNALAHKLPALFYSSTQDIRLWENSPNYLNSQFPWWGEGKLKLTHHPSVVNKFCDQVNCASAKYQLLTLPLSILKDCLAFIFDDSLKKKGCLWPLTYFV